MAGGISEKTQKMVLGALLMAIIVVMGFTPIGYIRIGTVIEITFLMIPVAVGAMVLGPSWGLFLGLMFGLTSFFQCFGYSPLGTVLFGINPISCAVLCIVPRVLMGWLTGLIFKSLSKNNKTGFMPFAISSVSAAALNTVLFTTAFIVFFRNVDLSEKFGINLAAMSLIDVILIFVTLNALLELVVCGVIGTALGKVLVKDMPKFGKRKKQF